MMQIAKMVVEFTLRSPRLHGLAPFKKRYRPGTATVGSKQRKSHSTERDLQLGGASRNRVERQDFSLLLLHGPTEHLFASVMSTTNSIRRWEWPQASRCFHPLDDAPPAPSCSR